MSNGTITVINTTPYKWQPVPEVGKEYHAFDDGKIKPSRHSIVRITEVVPFAAVNHKAFLEEWQQEVEDGYWLYAKETDYFIKAEYVEKDRPAYFVRTKDGGWFSLGFWGARLDIDGSLYEKMKEQYGEG